MSPSVNLLYGRLVILFTFCSFYLQYLACLDRGDNPEDIGKKVHKPKSHSVSPVVV